MQLKRMRLPNSKAESQLEETLSAMKDVSAMESEAPDTDVLFKKVNRIILAYQDLCTVIRNSVSGD